MALFAWDRGLEATAARRWAGAGGSRRPFRVRRSCAAVVAQACVNARPGRQPRESGTRHLLRGVWQLDLGRDWRLARGRATATGVRAGRPVTRRQWNRRAANLCSALASRRLVSEPIVIRAAFGISMRHHSRRGLAHKSRRSSHVAPAERRGHVAVDQRAARAGTPFRPRANTSRPASFDRKAMNENVVGIAPLGVGAKNAATGSGDSEGAHDGGCWRPHEYAAFPSRSRRRTARTAGSAQTGRPIPEGVAGPVATRTPGHVGRRDPACSPAGAECSIRRATRRQTTWPDPENVWQRERTTIAQRTHRQGASKEEG